MVGDLDTGEGELKYLEAFGSESLEIKLLTFTRFNSNFPFSPALFSSPVPMQQD